MDFLRDLSLRENQAYGAFCLHQFCKTKGIEHTCIDELIEHLLLILITSPLDEWERKGATLELNGRGKPIPDSLKTQLADDICEDFARLVCFVVEIGLGDMYGALTMGPLNDLLRCLSILDANGVDRPDVDDLFKDRMPREEDAGPYAGETISQERYEQVRALFK